MSGELWVSDYIASRVLRYSSAAAFANGEAANLVLGQSSFTAASCNRGGSPAANTLCSPIGVAVDQAGRLYVTDNSNNRLLVYRPPFTNGMDATWVVGQADFSGAADEPGRDAGCRHVVRAAWHRARLARLPVFVADSGNNRVLAYQAPLVTGAAAYRVFGQAGFTTNASATTATGMNFPEGLAIDKDDNLWVAEEATTASCASTTGPLAGTRLPTSCFASRTSRRPDPALPRAPARGRRASPWTAKAWSTSSDTPQRPRAALHDARQRGRRDGRHRPGQLHVR